MGFYEADMTDQWYVQLPIKYLTTHASIFITFDPRSQKLQLFAHKDLFSLFSIVDEKYVGINFSSMKI